MVGTAVVHPQPDSPASAPPLPYHSPQPFFRNRSLEAEQKHLNRMSRSRSPTGRSGDGSRSTDGSRSKDGSASNGGSAKREFQKSDLARCKSNNTALQALMQKTEAYMNSSSQEDLEALWDAVELARPAKGVRRRISRKKIDPAGLDDVQSPNAREHWAHVRAVQEASQAIGVESPPMLIQRTASGMIDQEGTHWVKEAKPSWIQNQIKCITDWLEGNRVLNSVNGWGFDWANKNRAWVILWLKILPGFLQLALISFLMTGLSSVPSVMDDTYWFGYQDITTPRIALSDGNLSFITASGTGRVYADVWGLYLDMSWSDGIVTYDCDGINTTKHYPAYNEPLYKVCGPCTTYPGCRNGDRTCTLVSFQDANTATLEHMRKLLREVNTTECFVRAAAQTMGVSDATFHTRLTGLATNFETMNLEWTNRANDCEKSVANIVNFLWISFFFGTLGSFLNLYSPRLKPKDDVGYQKFIGMFLAGPLPLLFNLMFITQYHDACFNLMTQADSEQAMGPSASSGEGDLGPGFVIACIFTFLAIPITISDWLVPVPSKTQLECSHFMSSFADEDDDDVFRLGNLVLPMGLGDSLGDSVEDAQSKAWFHPDLPEGKPQPEKVEVVEASSDQVNDKDDAVRMVSSGQVEAGENAEVAGTAPISQDEASESPHAEDPSKAPAASTVAPDQVPL